jgi:uncharacterized protein YacL
MYRKYVYGIGIVFYVTGLLLLVDVLYKLQNITFKNSYSSIIYPIFAMLLIGFYSSLLKLLKKIIEPKVKVKIRNMNKMLYLLIGIIILTLVSINFSFNNFTLLLAFIGYIISLIFGFRLIKVVNID